MLSVNIGDGNHSYISVIKKEGYDYSSLINNPESDGEAETKTIIISHSKAEPLRIMINI